MKHALNANYLHIRHLLYISYENRSVGHPVCDCNIRWKVWIYGKTGQMSLFNLIVNLRNDEKFHEFMSRSVECWMEWMASAAKKFLKITRTQVCKAKMRTYLEIFWKLKNWGKIQLGTFRTGPKCWQLCINDDSSAQKNFEKLIAMSWHPGEETMPMSRAGQQYYSSKLAMDSFTIVHICKSSQSRMGEEIVTIY